MGIGETTFIIMKKLFSITLFGVLFVFSTYAQDSWEKKGFEPQIRVTFDEGIDNFDNFSFGADFLAGYRFNEIVCIGAGVGLNYIDLRYEQAGWNSSLERYDSGYKESAMSFPVFANVKVNFTKTKISPFINVDLGYTAFLPFSKYAQHNKLGFLMRPAFGVDFHFCKWSLFLEIAYKYQQRQADDSYYTLSSVKFDGGYSQLSQSIGFQF